MPDPQTNKPRSKYRRLKRRLLVGLYNLAGPPLVVAWEDDPAREELARFEDATVVVNRLHPAYLQARDAGELDGHLGIAFAWALSGYVVPEAARTFIGGFLLRWADGDEASPPPPA